MPSPTITYGREPQRRSVAVDLRDEWQIALCNNDLMPTGRRLGSLRAWSISRPRPSSALFIYIDTWLALGSHVAAEEANPLDPVNSQRSSNENAPRTPKDPRKQSFQMVYNERWARPRNGLMSEAGATATPLAEYLRRVGR